MYLISIINIIHQLLENCRYDPPLGAGALIVSLLNFCHYCSVYISVAKIGSFCYRTIAEYTMIYKTFFISFV